MRNIHWRWRGLKLFLIGAGGWLLFFGLTPVGASSANISYAFKTNDNVPTGSLVSLDVKQSNTVILANSVNQKQLVGVVVAGNDSRIAVGATPGTVQVATSGTASTLVSTLGGSISTGDLIGVSPFNGVGIKALPGSRVIGIAQADFNSGSSGAVTESVTDKNGKSSTVKVGYIPVNISVTNAATITSNSTNSLQKLAKDVTGHAVSTLRVVVSLIIAIAAVVILITLVYTSIYGGIISVGRNPLAKYSIFRALGSVMALGLLTAVIAGGTIFLLLR